MNILKLAKNLKEFTLDEIEMLAECDCATELENLIQQNILQLDGQNYKYCEKIYATAFELCQKPELKASQKITFEQAFLQYMSARKLAKRTIKAYRSKLKYHVLPYLKDVPLDEITLPVLNRWTCILKTKYCQKTIRDTITMLGCVINWAFEEGLIEQHSYLGIRKIKKELWNEQNLSS